VDKRISTALIATRDTLFALLIGLPVQLVLRVILRLSGVPGPTEGVARATQLLEYASWTLPIVMAASSGGVLIAGWWFRRNRPVEGWDATGSRKLSWGRSIRIGIAVALLDIVLTAIVGTVTATLLGSDRIENPEIVALAGARGFVLLSFVVDVAVIGPVGEELFFRGHLFRWSASRCGLPYAYTLTAVIFALVHLNPPAIPVYVATALLLGWSYQRWRTLAVPMIAHATSNTVTILLTIAAVRAGVGA